MRHDLGLSHERRVETMTTTGLLLVAAEEAGQAYFSRREMEEGLRTSASSQLHLPLAFSVVSAEVAVLDWQYLTWLEDGRVTLAERLHRQIYLHQQVEVGL